MNGIFAAIFLLSCVVFLVVDPNGFLPALMSGTEKAAALCLSLLSVYCVWLGFFRVLEQSGLAEKITRILFPFTKKLFCSENKEALAAAGYNLSANLLGLPGAPTPLGIRAADAFCKDGNDYAADMLFVLNATSLQLLPATAIALRSAAGSVSPADAVLPTLAATLFSTVSGAVAVWFFSAKKQSREKKGKRFL